MVDNPIRTFFQFMTGGIPDQLHLGDLRWFTVVLYWAILIGSVYVFCINWRRDPSQRTAHHVSIYGMRVVSAGMWYLGTLWKLPLPVSAGFKKWLGETGRLGCPPTPTTPGTQLQALSRSTVCREDGRCRRPLPRSACPRGGAVDRRE